LDKLESALLRQVLWGAIYHMVRDAKLKVSDYLQLVRTKLPAETDLKLVGSVIYNARAAKSFLSRKKLVQQSDLMFEFCWKMLYAAQTGEIRLIWMRALISMAEQKETAQKLIDMLENGTGVPDFDLEQDMRWSISEKQLWRGIAGGEQRVSDEEKRDPSDRGVRAAARCRASVPDPEVKAKTWEIITHEKDLNLHVLNSMMDGFYRWNQKTILKPFEDKYFAEVREIYKTKIRDFATSFGESLFPHDPEDDSITKRAENLLASLNVDDEKPLVRMLKEQLDDIQRSKKVMTFEDS